MDAAKLTSLTLGLLHDPAFQPKRENLYETISTRFAGESDGAKVGRALQEFMDDPRYDYSSTVEKKLFSLLQTDQNFAEHLRAIINTGARQELTPREEISARHIRMANSLDIGRQEIKAGNYSIIENVRVNIKEIV